MAIENLTRYCIGDYVNYRNSGICIVEDIKETDIGYGKREYYFLRSVYEKDTSIKIPTNSKAVKQNIRRVLSKEEIIRIISETENTELKWIDDYKKRAVVFEEILNSGNRADILWIIKMLSLYRIQAKNQKRKFGVTDEKILDKAEKIILQEFAFILNIDQKEVIPYIVDHISQEN